MTVATPLSPSAPPISPSPADQPLSYIGEYDPQPAPLPVSDVTLDGNESHLPSIVQANDPENVSLRQSDTKLHYTRELCFD